MKVVRTSCPVSGQHLHAWHVNDEKGVGGGQNEANAWDTSLKHPPCQLPFTITLATTDLHLPTPRWLTGDKVNAFGKGLKGLALDVFSFFLNGQPSRALHERRLKNIELKLKRIITAADCGRQVAGTVLTCVTSNAKTGDIFTLILFILLNSSYWLGRDWPFVSCSSNQGQMKG